MTTIENLQLDFDLEEFIDTTVLLIGYSYKIQTLPAHHREEYVVFINEKGNYTFYWFYWWNIPIWAQPTKRYGHNIIFLL